MAGWPCGAPCGIPWGSPVGGDAGSLFDTLKEGLAAPLGGMGISFSSSLFGLAGSLILLISVLTIIGTLISDILLAITDPRIRLQ